MVVWEPRDVIGSSPPQWGGILTKDFVLVERVDDGALWKRPAPRHLDERAVKVLPFSIFVVFESPQQVQNGFIPKSQKVLFLTEPFVETPH